MELEVAFQSLLQNAPDDFKFLFALNHPPTRDKTQLEEGSKWYKYFQDKELNPADNIEDHGLIWKHLSTWLDLVLYETCTFIPLITEDRAHNLALGHPLSLWLLRFAGVVDAACQVGMIIVRVREEDLPQSLIRLPILTTRFNTILLPKLQEFTRETVKQLWEIKPEYMRSLYKLPHDEQRRGREI
jgi:hypothetical protein